MSEGGVSGCECGATTLSSSTAQTRAPGAHDCRPVVVLYPSQQVEDLGVEVGGVRGWRRGGLGGGGEGRGGWRRGGLGGEVKSCHLKTTPSPRDHH